MAKSGVPYIYSYFGYHWWYLLYLQYTLIYYLLCNLWMFVTVSWAWFFFQGNVLLESRWIWNWPARKVWMLSVNDALSCVQLRWFKYYVGRVWIQSKYNRGCLRPRTTDAWWGNCLHCTAQNQIPIPIF